MLFPLSSYFLLSPYTYTFSFCLFSLTFIVLLIIPKYCLIDTFLYSAHILISESYTFSYYHQSVNIMFRRKMQLSPCDQMENKQSREVLCKICNMISKEILHWLIVKTMICNIISSKIRYKIPLIPNHIQTRTTVMHFTLALISMHYDHN